MRACIDAKDIEKEVKKQLPVIDDIIFKEHFCTECPYYAGKCEHQPRCMLKKCAWDGCMEIFSAPLRKMIPIFEREFLMQKKKYLEAKKKRELILLMFKDELAEEQRNKEICSECSFKKNGPCVGFCYKQMSADPS